MKVTIIGNPNRGFGFIKKLQEIAEKEGSKMLARTAERITQQRKLDHYAYELRKMGYIVVSKQKMNRMRLRVGFTYETYKSIVDHFALVLLDIMKDVVFKSSNHRNSVIDLVTELKGLSESLKYKIEKQKTWK